MRMLTRRIYVPPLFGLAFIAAVVGQFTLFFSDGINREMYVLFGPRVFDVMMAIYRLFGPLIAPCLPSDIDAGPIGLMVGVGVYAMVFGIAVVIGTAVVRRGLDGDRLWGLHLTNWGWAVIAAAVLFALSAGVYCVQAYRGNAMFWRLIDGDCGVEITRLTITNSVRRVEWRDANSIREFRDALCCPAEAASGAGGYDVRFEFSNGLSAWLNMSITGQSDGDGFVVSFSRDSEAMEPGWPTDSVVVPREGGALSVVMGFFNWEYPNEPNGLTVRDNGAVEFRDRQ